MAHNAETVPQPRSPSEEDAYVSWYGRVLGWTLAGGPPAQLVTGTRFDVLELPTDAGGQLLRRPVDTGPVAVMGRRMRFLVAPGSAEELDGLLDWLEWGPVALDLTALGAGGRITAPVPPGRPQGSPRGPPCGCGPRTGVRGVPAVPARYRTGRRGRPTEHRTRSRTSGRRGGHGVPPGTPAATRGPREARRRRGSAPVLVGLANVGGDTAASLTVRPCAFAHARISAVSGLPAETAARPGASSGGTATGAAATLGVGLEQAAELFSVGGGEVDLVGLAIHSERHGLVRLATVEVVDKKDLNLLCHRISFHRKCSTRKGNRFCLENTNPRREVQDVNRAGNVRDSDIGHRRAEPSKSGRDRSAIDQRCRSIRLLPKVFGFTRSRPRNSATPSS